jgi:hypothetical protein
MKKMMFLTLALLVAAAGSVSAASNSNRKAHRPKKVVVNIVAPPKVKCDATYGGECHHRFDHPKCDRFKGPKFKYKVAKFKFKGSKCKAEAPRPRHGARVERGRYLPIWGECKGYPKRYSRFGRCGL